MQTNTPHPPFNYSRITDYIFLGTNACCQRHFDENLISLGVKADISLEKERLDQPLGVDFFIWLPVADARPPKTSQLELGTQALTLFTHRQIKVYVHCRLGHGRSPSLIIAYFMSLGKSYEEAHTLVKTHRPEIHLTADQEKALRKFSAKLSKREGGHPHDKA